MKSSAIWTVLCLAGYARAQSSCTALTSGVPSCAATAPATTTPVAPTTSSPATSPTLTLVPTSSPTSPSTSLPVTGTTSATTRPIISSSVPIISPASSLLGGGSFAGGSFASSISRSFAGGSLASSIGSSFAPSGSTCAVTPASTPNCNSQAAQIPSCALNCFSNAVAEIGCTHTDYQCQCTPANTASLTSAVTPCVISACPSLEYSAVQSAADALCSCANSGGSSASTSCFAVSTKTTSTSGSSGSGVSSVVASSSTIALPSQFSGGANQFQAGVGIVGAAILAAVALY